MLKLHHGNYQQDNKEDSALDGLLFIVQIRTPDRRGSFLFENRIHLGQKEARPLTKEKNYVYNGFRTTPRQISRTFGFR